MLLAAQLVEALVAIRWPLTRPRAAASGAIFVLAGALAGSGAVVNVTRAPPCPRWPGRVLRSALALNFWLVACWPSSARAWADC